MPGMQYTICCISKLPPRSTITLVHYYPNHTTHPPTHRSICGHGLEWYSTKGTSSLANRPSHQRAEGCGKGGVTSNLHHSTRARLHESRLSPAGLPKYDLFSPSKPTKAPCARNLGANSAALATHAPPSPHPNMPPRRARQGRFCTAVRKRDGDSHPRRHTPASC